MNLAEEEREAESAGLASSTRRWAAVTFEPFQLRTYRLLWIGNFFLFLAFFTSVTAQSVVAFDLTGNNGSVGFVLFGQGLALLMLFPFGGAIADRFSKKKLLLMAQAVFCGLMLATAILIGTDRISILLLAISTFIAGAMFTINAPTRVALLGETVSRDRIGSSVALIQLGSNVGAIVGPLIAGVLLSVAFIGASGTYYGCAFAFFLSFVTLLNLPNTAPKKVDKSWGSVIADVRMGVRYLFSTPRLLHVVGSFYFVIIIGLSYMVVMPAFAKEVLDSGNQGLGILMGAASAGGFVMSIIVASLANSKRAPFFLSVCSFVAGVALFLTGLAPSLLVASVTMLFASAGLTGFQTLSNAFSLQSSEQQYHGRLFGLIFMAMGLRGMASPIVGIIADNIGERTVLSGSGAILCVVVVIMTLTRPAAPADA